MTDKAEWQDRFQIWYHAIDKLLTRSPPTSKGDDFSSCAFRFIGEIIILAIRSAITPPNKVFSFHNCKFLG